MSKYQLTDGNVIVADQAFVDAHYPGATLLPDTDAPAATLDTRITRMAFRSRFTTAEKVALELAALDDPAATLPQRQAAAVVRVYLTDMAAAAYIDLADPATVAGVQALQTATLLTAERAAEILTAPVQPHEAA